MIVLTIAGLPATRSACERDDCTSERERLSAYVALPAERSAVRSYLVMHESAHKLDAWDDYEYNYKYRRNWKCKCELEGARIVLTAASVISRIICAVFTFTLRLTTMSYLAKHHLATYLRYLNCRDTTKQGCVKASSMLHSSLLRRNREESERT